MLSLGGPTSKNLLLCIKSTEKVTMLDFFQNSSGSQTLIGIDLTKYFTRN